ncbi:MAG: DUF348 domain-containing protein [Chloroflexi bacterium]|nr:ubiquitin-like domain-containing protein [Anaerolineaceae bacterium]NMB90741.1 DUF348 domain-containing protein [Chloroflexota bacterium]
MNKKLMTLAPLGLILVGLALIIIGTRRTITLIVNGQPRTIYSHAWTVAWALRDAGLTPGPSDHVVPGTGSWLGWSPTIRVDRAVPVQWISPAQGLTKTIQSTQRLPGNLLAEAGIRLYPGDRLYWNGLQVLPDQPLPLSTAYTLQYRPGQAITLTSGGQVRTFSSAAATLAAALWEAGIHLEPGDRLTPAPDTPLNQPLEASLSRAVPLAIQVDGQSVEARSSAATVGQALADAGLSLQGLDYSIPAEQDPVPAGGQIQVVRVREEIQLTQETIPYESEVVEAPELELGQQGVVAAGQLGLKVARTRLRYADGQETARQTEAEWTAKEPVAEKLGYGTQVVVKTLDTPSGTIEYYRAVTVYATSYSPCRSGGDRCYNGTASGLPVQRGVISVSSAWYRMFAGAQVYVPGYGLAVIGDVGGGIPGEYWIDLAFTDDDFEAWHQNVTLYFLTPVPSNVPWALP